MTENDKTDAIEKKEEAFVRWEGITRVQLSYSINLILTFSLAAIGFIASLLLNDDFQVLSYEVLFYASLLFFLISGAFGIACTITRLKDFRKTTRINKLKKDKLKCNNSDCKDRLNDELKELRCWTKILGKVTWAIFWWQIGTFSTGVFLFLLFIVCTRLF